MAKTTVPSRNLASAMDPVTRDYVNAKISEELKPIRDDMVAVLEALSEMRTENEVSKGEHVARINMVEEVLELSGAKVAKIRQLMEDIDG